MTDNQEKSHNSISENKAVSIRKKRRKVPINLVPCHLRLSPQSSVLSPMHFSQSSEPKRSSSEGFIKRSAPDADRIDGTKMFPNLIFDLLNNGHEVKFRAPGYSMHPTISHEDVITVEPVEASAVKVGDIVLYRDQQSLIAHRVVNILKRSEKKSRSAPQGPLDRSDSPTGVITSTSETIRFILRGDARPACDDPINAEQILGKIVSVERNGRCINPYSLKFKLIRYARRLLSRLKRLLN